MRRIKQFAIRRRTAVVRFLTIAIAVCVSVAMLSQAASAQNTYLITDGDLIKYHTSFATDPIEVLDEAGFELGKDDTYTTQESGGISEIYVKRVQTITINNGGQLITMDSPGETVESLLTRMSIAVDPHTAVSQPLDAETYDGMQISVDRTTYVTETYTQTIPHNVTELRDTELPEGQTKILTAGSDGEMVCTAQVTYVNGVETGRTVLSSQVTQAPTDELVAVGAAPEKQLDEVTIGDGIITTASGDILTYTGSLQVLATAYNSADEGCGIYNAIGTYCRVGAIAVDPAVIPYGTMMYIVSNDGKYIYGIASAEDCGTGIDGLRIDLYFDTVEECVTFGVRDCTVYFLG